MNETKGTIENWYLGFPNPSPYDPPERISPILYGDLGEKHKRFSTPVSYCEESNVLTTTTGSKYLLGNPKEDYEKHYPNARKRLIEKINKDAKIS